MSIRFQKTPRGEVAILPRKDYELLVAKAAEADEDAGTAYCSARPQGNCRRRSIAAERHCRPLSRRGGPGACAARMARTGMARRHDPNVFVAQNKSQPRLYLGH